MSEVRHAGYQNHLHKPDYLLAAARWVVSELARYAPTAQAIVARGMSGVVVASVASALSGKPLIIIRKPEDKHHAYNRVQGPYGFHGPYVVVDDFSESGSTLKEILSACATADAGECVGIFLYAEYTTYPNGYEYCGTPIPTYTHHF